MSSNPEAKILFTRREIHAVVKRLAAEIRRDYHEKNPLVIGVLKGSFVFLSDIVRLLDFPLEVEFIRLSSYGRSRTNAGEIKLTEKLHTPVKGRHLLIVEDIIDTGNSLKFLVDYLSRQQPASIKLCVLTDKPSRREAEVDVHYRGFAVPDKFIVGYGLDWDERFRNLPDLRYIESEKRSQDAL